MFAEKSLVVAGLVLRTPHGVGDEAHRLEVRREDLVALGLVVLDEVAAHPELVAGVGEELRPQAELGLDDRADDHAPVLERPAEDAPEVGDVAPRSVEELEVRRRHVEVVHLGVLDVAHALVVADGEREERDDHRLAVADVAVEELERIGDLHQLGGLVGFVDDGVDRAREVVGRGDLHVGARGGLGGEVSGRGQEAVAGLGLHEVSAQDVPALSDQVGLSEVQIGIPARLVHGRTPRSRAGCLGAGF